MLCSLFYIFKLFDLARVDIFKRLSVYVGYLIVIFIYYNGYRVEAKSGFGVSRVRLCGTRKTYYVTGSIFLSRRSAAARTGEVECELYRAYLIAAEFFVFGYEVLIISSIEVEPFRITVPLIASAGTT